MKHHTKKEFELIDLHDSLIEKIERHNEDINIFLAFANLRAEHSANTHGPGVSIEPCILTFKTIISESAKVFNEDKKTFEHHPDPTQPLGNEILEASNRAEGVTCYTLKGFHRLGWSEWDIYCHEFELKWDRFDGDAWWVNWCSV